MLEAIHNENVFNFFSENKMDTQIQNRQNEKKNVFNYTPLCCSKSV